MSVIGTVWKRFVLRTERSSFALNRWTGIAQYKDPSRYLDVDREALEAYCAAAQRDLFAYLRPPSIRMASLAVTRGPCVSRQDPDLLTFASPRPSGMASNDTVRVHFFRATGRAEGTLLFHHPAFRTGLGWIAWFTRPLRRRYDVAVMEAPYHLARAPKGTYSGERMINPNPIHLYEALRQWMADHRALLTILEAQAAAGEARARPVGIAGYSLGAYLATLYARFEPRLPVIGICPSNDYASLVYDGVMLTSLRAALTTAGITRADWERLTDSLRLDPHAPDLCGDRFLLFAAKHDGVEPWESLERFARALGPRRLVLLPSGHSTTAVLFRGRIARETLRFLDEISAADGSKSGADDASGAGTAPARFDATKRTAGATLEGETEPA